MVTVFRYTSHRFGTHLILHFLTSTFSGALFQTLVIDSENKKAALLITGERLRIRSWKPAPFLKMKKAGILMASRHENSGRVPNDKFLKTL